MIVTAWNNGAHSRNGSGYGFRILAEDRDALFQKDWTSIILEIEGEAVEAPFDAAKLWGDAPYYIQSAALGRWLRKNGLAPWRLGNAPVFVLEPGEGNHFSVHKAVKGHSGI